MRALFFACLIFGFGSYLHAQCHAPHFRSVGSLNAKVYEHRISLEPRDFTLANLICLVQILKERHATWKSIELEIYNSQYAAEVFHVPGAEAPSIRFRPQVQPHAIYVLDRDKHEDDLYIFPFGWLDTTKAEQTRINFPVSGTRQCRLGIRDRCLMMAEPAEYPYEALKNSASGKVALVGTVTSEGKIAGIQLEDAEMSQSDGGKLLLAAAKQNLASWQLEPGKGQDSIRITYSYIIDPSLGQYLMSADFDSPNHMVIRGNPSAIHANP